MQNFGRRIFKGMEIFSTYRGLKGWNRLIEKYRSEAVITESARIKEKIVNFFEEFGLEATIKAFGKKKSSIYNYRKKFIESNGNLEVLNDKSKAPIHKRRSNVNPKIIEFIKDIRKQIADIGKKKIKIFLDKYCQENNLLAIPQFLRSPL